MEIAKSSILYVVSAPSGAGKTTLVQGLTKRHAQTAVSVSHTTRLPRQDEVDGEDYYFVTPEAFEAMQQQGDFVESAWVYGKQYGTSKRQLEELMRQYSRVILEIDWQGAAQIKERFPLSVHLFILPPNLPVLKQRLIARKSNSEGDLQQRIAAMPLDILHSKTFDYFIINDDLEKSWQEMEAIMMAQEASVLRQGNYLQQLLQQWEKE